MNTSSGASWVGTIVGIAALAAIGIGGYNFFRSGCPLGGCETPASAAAPGSADGCCPLSQAAAMPGSASASCPASPDHGSCSTTGAQCPDAAAHQSECTGDPAHCTRHASESAGEKSQCPAAQSCPEAARPAAPSNPG